jgi:hypothetical protein
MSFAWNLYLTFGLMVATNESSQLDILNLLWRQIIYIPTNCMGKIVYEPTNTYLEMVQNSEVTSD